MPKIFDRQTDSLVFQRPPSSRTIIEPRLLGCDAAASYCGLSVPTFRAACEVIPIKIRSRILYDRRAIDLWIDSLSSQGPHSASHEELLGRLDRAYAH